MLRPLLAGAGRARGKHSPDLVHPPGDGCFGYSQDFGSLGVRELLSSDEHRRVPKRRLHFCDSTLQPNRVVKVTAVGSRRNPGQYGELFAEGEERPAPSPEITAGVEGDAAQPCREFGVATKAPELLDQGAADILGNVVGVRPRSGQLPCEAVDQIVMPLEQRREGSPVAAFRSSDKAGIGIAAVIGRQCCPPIKAVGL